MTTDPAVIVPFHTSAKQKTKWEGCVIVANFRNKYFLEKSSLISKQTSNHLHRSKADGSTHTDSKWTSLSSLFFLQKTNHKLIHPRVLHVDLFYPLEPL